MRVDIDGNILDLNQVEKTRLKGLWAEAKWTFDYYECSFGGRDFMVPSLKQGKEVTPLQLEHYAYRLDSFFSKPIVFLLPRAPRYQRVRYAERGIFYIMPDKGYARLPFLYTGKKMSDRTRAKRLTPVAQYLLLSHLQFESLDGKTLSEISSLVPQSYLTVSRAVTTLEDIGLGFSDRFGKTKVLHFKFIGKDLWEKAQPYLVSPILTVRYYDAFDGSGLIGGINALAHYSHLNPEEMQTLVLERNLVPEDIGLEDGRYRIEVWKYPPIGGGPWVDRLSLALSLQENKDERVQKEIELMINAIWSTE
ncbi:MAG: hypothetical protein J6O51_09765 [Bacteroidales bacterium]|nr:hypothetical protein [Bacteroidales bacterium]